MRRLTAFERGLALIALVALAIRCWYAVAHRNFIVLGDAMTFHQVAQHMADGEFFRQAFTGAPTAEHPPMWELVLAGVDKLGFNGYLAHRLLGGAIGTVTVVLIGLLGRRLAGVRVGLLAAGLAAVYPIFWTADGSLMSETLYVMFVVAGLLAALWFRERPSVWRGAVLGALVALAALTRGEALGLLVLLALPLAWRAGFGWRRRAGLFAAVVAACALVIAPWTIRNLVTFHDPVLISTNANGLWIGANCPATYYGPLIGSWRFQCYTRARPGEDESQYFDRQRRIGMSYMEHHLGRLPAVIVAREARLFDVFNVGQSLFLNAVEGRPAGPMRWAIRASWAMMLAALAGAVLLARRRRWDDLVVLLAPVALVIIVAAVTYGSTRFRAAAEPSFCILAATAVAAVWVFARARRPGAWRRVDRGLVDAPVSQA